MLKKRLIPVLYIKNGFIVRSENFEEFKIIGNVVNEVRRYNQWDIDELVYVDISRDKNYDSKRDDHKINRVNSIDDVLDVVSKECFMPLTFGGGVRDLATIKKYLKNGADKVILNTMLHTNAEAVKEAVQIFGSQAIVAGIDYRIINDEVCFFIENGTKKIDYNLKQLSDYILELGCGEVFLTSIDRDGAGEGYDLKTIEEVVNQFSIPVVACGGALQIFDFEEVAEIEAISGIAAGNMFHFTENIYPRSKKKLRKNNSNFR
ncbi:MAG: HisA/HisF-related TIM barrel protein [Lutibacter sp.]